MQFLAAHDLLIPDATRPSNIDQDVIEQQVAALPAPLAREIRAWITVLRDEGRRPSPPMAWDGIRRYTYYLLPVVSAWSQQISSLRTITTDDIHVVLEDRPASNTRGLLNALKSLFKALKRERIIFRDPARAVRGPTIVIFPRPLPPGRLQGLLDQAPTILARVVVALVAIHALRESEVRALLLPDLDRSAGRLLVRRPHGPRRVILDELTLRLVNDWLRERAHRWPHSTNPHLLVSQQSSTDPTGKAMSRYTLHRIFDRIGLSPSQLRIDRILDEAQHTADPVHLMRVFGIGDTTAMRYIYTAHPERRSTLPR